MALRVMEGFDCIDFSQVPSKLSAQSGVFGSFSGGGGFATHIGSPGVYGYGSCMMFNNYQGANGFTVALDNQPTLITCFHFSCPSDAGRPIVWFYDANTCQSYLSSNSSTGRVELHRGDGTLLATGTINVCDGAWHYLEVSVTFNGTTGASVVNVDLIQQFSVTSINTIVSANSYANAISIYRQNSSGYMSYDNWVVMDTTGSTFNAFQGEMRIFGVLPNQAGNYAQWTPSTGANFSCVNQNPDDGDTTYISTTSTGNLDSYKFASLPFTAGTIKAVWVNIVAKSSDVGVKTVSILSREAGTDYVGSNVITLGNAYSSFGQFYNVDPAGSAWTITNFNNMEFGIKEVS